MSNRKDKVWMMAIAIPLLGTIAVCLLSIIAIVLDVLFGLGLSN